MKKNMYGSVLIDSKNKVTIDNSFLVTSYYVKSLIQMGIDVARSRVLLVGFEGWSKAREKELLSVRGLCQELLSYGVEVVVFDPSNKGTKNEFLKSCEVISEISALDETRFLRRDHRYGKTKQCFDGIIILKDNASLDKNTLLDVIDLPGLVFEIEEVPTQELNFCFFPIEGKLWFQ